MSKKVFSHGLTLILDAYNVIHAVPQLEKTLTGKLEHARRALIEYCRQYQAQHGNIRKIILIFDGRKTQEFFWQDNASSQEGDIEILFSDPGQTADDKIIELLEHVKNPENFIVVSNDNYVANNARSHQVRVLSVNGWDQAVKKKTFEKGLSLAQDSAVARKITEDYKQYLGIKD